MKIQFSFPLYLEASSGYQIYSSHKFGDTFEYNDVFCKYLEFFAFKVKISSRFNPANLLSNKRI